MLQPDTQDHVKWSALEAVAAAAMRLATGAAPPDECVQALVRG